MPLPLAKFNPIPAKNFRQMWEQKKLQKAYVIIVINVIANNISANSGAQLFTVGIPMGEEHYNMVKMIQTKPELPHQEG